MVRIILLVFAFILALLASFGISTSKIQFGWMALALFFLSIILEGVIK